MGGVQIISGAHIKLPAPLRLNNRADDNYNIGILTTSSVSLGLWMAQILHQGALSSSCLTEAVAAVVIVVVIVIVTVIVIVIVIVIIVSNKVVV